MNVIIEKIGVRDGKERFILVDSQSGAAITQRDVSEPTMRKYLKSIGETDPLIDEAFAKARKRFDKVQAAKESEADDSFEDIFTEIVLEDGDSDIE